MAKPLTRADLLLTDAEREVAAEYYDLAVRVMHKALAHRPECRREDYLGVAALAMFRAIKTWRPDGGRTLKTYIGEWVFRHCRWRERRDAAKRMPTGMVGYRDAANGGSGFEPEGRPEPERDDTADRALAVLKARRPDYYRVLDLRYGLSGGRLHDLASIAAILGVTRQAVSMQEARALDQLRYAMGLNPDVERRTRKRFKCQELAGAEG